MELKKLKKAEDEAYFQALFGMYPTEGWAVLLEDLTRLKEIYNTVTTVGTVEELWFRRGQLDMIDQLLTHRDRTEHAYASAIETQEGKAEAPTGGKAKVIS